MAPPNVKIKHITRSPSSSGDTRFPKLDECAHFHYENVELGPIKVFLCDKASESSKLAVVSGSSADKENEVGKLCFLIMVISNSRKWMVRRNYKNFMFLDTQLHRCVYDRKYSLLKELPNLTPEESENDDFEEKVHKLLSEYLERFSQLAGSLINCGPVLNWFELDNRGNRLIVTDEVAINTPAVAAAYVIVPYSAQAPDEISFDVGDMISVIDMPPPEESSWWRGKKGFEVGFFPSECVEVIGDKVPHSFKISNASTKPVFRRQGKLIAFFRSFLLSRPSRRKLKQSGILKERVFGCDLGEHLLNTGRDIPMVLKCCAEFIEEYGVVDGIYRLSGVSSNIQRLRLAFDEDRPLNLGDPATVHDIHSVASLLKMYFRELPNPLLTYQLYDKFVSAVQSSEDVRLLRVRDVVQQLPPPHFRTLQYLLKHLAKVASRGEETGMTPKNIAIVWAPNLLRSRDVENGGVGALHVVGVQAVLTEYLIRFEDLIFEEKVTYVPGCEQSEGFMLRARPKSLAISTPTKLLSLEEARARAFSTHLPLTQQKYIEVGGGPDKLPSKYHTVIDLPHGKNSLPKLKKSPSGWKSFFSRGWYSGSARDKSRQAFRTSRKASTGSLPHPSTYLQEKASSETDSSCSNRKKLRTVKSAESLAHCLKEVSYPIKVESGDSSVKSSPEVSVDSSNSSAVVSPFSKSPGLQKHARSSSHESYFESNSMDIMSDPSFDEDEHGLFYYVSEQMRMLQDSSLPWQSETQEQTATSQPSGNNQKEGGKKSYMGKNMRKQKSSDVADSSAQAKVQKLAEAFDMTRGWQSSETSCRNSSLLQDAQTDDVFESDMATEQQEISRSNDESLTIDPMLLYNAILNNRNSIISSSDTENEINSRTIVERYGNAETVLVEVHATQESSSEEDSSDIAEDRSNFKEDPVVISDKVHQNESSLKQSPISDYSNPEDISVLSPIESQCPMFHEETLLTENGVKHSESPEQSDIANEIVSFFTSNELPDHANKLVEVASPEAKSPIEKSPNSVTATSLPSEPKPRLTQGLKQSDSSEPKVLKSPKGSENPPANVSPDPKAAPTSSINVLPSSPSYLAKSLKLPDLQSIKNKIETVPVQKKKHIIIPSPSSPIEEVRKKFELQSKKTAESPTTEVKSRLHFVELSDKETTTLETSLPAIESLEAALNATQEKKRVILKDSVSQKPDAMFKDSVSPKSDAMFKDSVSPKPDVILKDSVSPKSDVMFKDSVSPKSDALFKDLVSTKSDVMLKDSVSPKSDTVFTDLVSPKSDGLAVHKRHSEPPPKSDSSPMADFSKRSSNKYEGEPCVPKPVEKVNKPRVAPQQPSLFTQLKIRKLQSLKVDSSAPPPEPIDPWSDPILDMQEEYHPMVYSPSQKNKSSDSFDFALSDSDSKSQNEVELSPEPSLEESCDVPDRKVSEKQEPAVSDMKIRKPQSEVQSDADVSLMAETDKSCHVPSETVTAAPASDAPDNAASASSKNSDSSIGGGKAVESEAEKRERINRIKEERRAQLREKLKSESFRLEAEEKEKVQTKFRLRKDCRSSSTEDSPKDVKKSDKAVETDAAEITETGTNCDLNVVSSEATPKEVISDKVLGGDSGQKDGSRVTEDKSSARSKKSPRSYEDSRKWLSMPPTDIRDKVAIFERSNESKELFRLGPNGKFLQKQSPSALTSSYVR